MTAHQYDWWDFFSIELIKLGETKHAIKSQDDKHNLTGISPKARSPPGKYHRKIEYGDVG